MTGWGTDVVETEGAGRAPLRARVEPGQVPTDDGDRARVCLCASQLTEHSEAFQLRPPPSRPLQHRSQPPLSTVCSRCTHCIHPGLHACTRGLNI